jgi:hypothetical protein
MTLLIVKLNYKCELPLIIFITYDIFKNKLIIWKLAIRTIILDLYRGKPPYQAVPDLVKKENGDMPAIPTLF